MIITTNNQAANALNAGAKTLQLLIAVFEKFKNHAFSESYRELGKMFGMTHENVRHHFKKLEKFGYLSINKENTHKFIFTLNIDKLKELSYKF